ncbi:MAG: PRC-barrel domain-containing protein [Gemmatimonadaceae bacterium]|nr:PRC-barrel domain-containing protein [Gemmatimonadaceae bacterium]
MPVIGCDDKVAGTVVDLWVNRSEPSIAYYEVQLVGSEARRLLPYGFVQWPNLGLWGVDRLLVKSITAAQFAQVPVTKRDDRITLLEEDKIMAYYAGGHLYATPKRQEPWL